MKPRTITVLDISGGMAAGAWTLTDLSYGAETAWSLRAKFHQGDKVATVEIDRPKAFRVTDEGDLNWYWSTLSERAAGLGFVYELEGSAWLSEYESSTSFPDSGVRHFLLAGSDDCLEILAHLEPVVARPE